MEAWRRVEVAACEEMDGPTPTDLEAIRARDVHRRGGPGTRDASPTTTSPRSSTCCRRAPGRGGRWIHYGLTSSRRARHRAGAAARGRRRDRGGAARASSSTRSPRRRAQHVDTVCVGRTHGVHAEPTTFGIKLAGFAFEAHRNARAPASARSTQASVGAISGAVGTYSATEPRLRGAACSSAWACSAEPVSTQVVPRDRHAELLQAIALAGAGLERLATEIRHLQRTEVREAEEPFRAGQQKGSQRDAAQAQPDHHRAHHRPGARAARQRHGRGRERRPLARARHLATRAPSASSCPTRRSCSTTCSTSRCASCAAWSSHADRMRANLDLTHGALFSPARRCWRSSSRA